MVAKQVILGIANEFFNPAPNDRKQMSHNPSQILFLGIKGAIFWQETESISFSAKTGGNNAHS
jgi:hypothetical protein